MNDKNLQTAAIIPLSDLIQLTLLVTYNYIMVIL